MRATLSTASIVTALALVACGGGGTSSDDDGTTPDAGNPPAEGFRIETPPIRIEAGQEVTYCYYTTIPASRTMGVKKWSSHMSPGSHHLILFLTNDTTVPDGTINQDCDFFNGGGGGGGLNLPFWVYSAQTPDQNAPLPAGVGMTINQGQRAFVQMHYLNATEQAIMANVTIDADAYPANEQYTPAAAYVTYNTNISIQPHSTGSAGGDCTIPAGAKFYALGTHSHHFSTHTQVNDGTSMVFQSDNWDHPGSATWGTNPYYTFASGKLSYHCDYNNTTDARVEDGSSAQTNEMCMAVGYFFPATAAKFCINSFAVP